MLDLIRDNKTLVIDDDEFLRGAMEAMFNSSKKNMTAVETAEEGLELVEDYGFFLIFCDYILPGMNGLEFFLRSKEFDSDPILILITGRGNQEIFDRAREIGIDGIIEKPLTIRKIVVTLEKIMEYRR